MPAQYELLHLKTQRRICRQAKGVHLARSPVATQAQFAPARNFARIHARNLLQIQCRQRVVAVHKERQWPAQGARIERRMGDAKGDRLMAGRGAVALQLRRGKQRTHGGKSRAALGQGLRRKPRAAQIQRQLNVRVAGAESRSKCLHDLLHIVVAHDLGRAVCIEPEGCARQLQRACFVAWQRCVQRRSMRRNKD